MNEKHSEIFSEFILKNKKRKKLLPWWIIVFAWIFVVCGLLAPVVLILGILGYNFEISLYGYETNQPLSLIGITLTLLFAFKGITAYCLLYGKKWAITLGVIDATLGILACIFSMFFPLSSDDGNQNFVFRLELLALFPYLYYLGKVKSKWETLAIDDIHPSL